MKKLATCAMALMFATSLVACGNNTKPVNGGNDKNNTTSLEESNKKPVANTTETENKETQDDKKNQEEEIKVLNTSSKIFRNKLASNLTNQIQHIEFVEKIPDLSDYTVNKNKWDASLNQDGSIMVWFTDDNKTLYFSADGVIQAPKNCSNLFSNYKNLESIKFNGLFDTSQVELMNHMFYGCENLTSIDVADFDTSDVTSMISMFSGCKNLQSLNVSNWDVSNVDCMSSMFFGCEKLQTLDVSKWNVSKVETMQNMFWDCYELKTLDISNWDTYNLSNKYDMFHNCPAGKNV